MLDIIKHDIYRGPNIGIFSKVNDGFVFIPNGFSKPKAKTLADHLKTEAIFAAVANTRLIGALMSLNNQGILLPPTASEFELEYLKKSTGLNVEILETKYTALGNMICANDKGAIVSPAFSKESVKKIEDVLGVEVLQKRVAGYHQVGAMMIATSHGGIIHPETDDDDIRIIANVLGVNIEPATINGGIPYISSGILANNHTVVVGSFTNGPEIMMLTRAFTD